jgi:SAM-dependent methyltransferase
MARAVIRFKRLVQSSPANWRRYVSYKVREQSFLLRNLLGAATAKERRAAMVGPVSLWKMKRDFQIIFLKSRGLRPDNYLLDIGCGVLRGGIPIIQYLADGHYYGVEVRKAALEEGIRALREAGLESKRPNLCDIEKLSQVNLGRRFDVVWAFSTLIHMDDRVLDECFDFIGRHLAPSGCFYGNMQIGDDTEGQWLHFPVVWRPLEFYEVAAQRHGLKLANLGPLRSLGHVSGSPLQDNMTMLRMSLGPA